MKYFVISDVHGFYDEMIAALHEAGFDPSNPDHTLISCGDAWDRGPKPVEVAEFLTSLQRAVLLRGNHEDLLEEAICRGYFQWHDGSNGTVGTCEAISGIPYDSADKEYAMLQKTLEHSAFQNYFSKLVPFYETEHYIFVHSWIPDEEDWRNAGPKEWRNARWPNPFECTNPTEKKIVFGHWHTSWARAHLDGTHKEFPPTGDPALQEAFAPYDTGTAIGIDACTAYTGFCNCLVLED